MDAPLPAVAAGPAGCSEAEPDLRGGIVKESFDYYAERINRYIEDNIENYNLSLTELARMTGFNPSYLSRLYRMHTGKKLSEQIDEVKLRHAQELILAGSEEVSILPDAGPQMPQERRKRKLRPFPLPRSRRPQRARQRKIPPHLHRR